MSWIFGLIYEETCGLLKENVIREAVMYTENTKRKNHGFQPSRRGGIETAQRLLLPEELAKHAVLEGTKTVIQYTSAK